ncbi:MAG: Xaa-Pro peptidase family protein [Oscillospiraceae bacterium]|nr:Xaa-Pro peptidase family protein [Oscillospiraceae bacterium]
MNRLPSLQALLEEESFDALLLTSRVARYYATDLFTSAGMVLITRQGGTFYTDFRYIEAARTRLSGYAVEITDHTHPYRETVGKALARARVKMLGFEQDTMTLTEYETLSRAFSVDFVPAHEALHRRRRVKDTEELARMEEAQRIAERGFLETLPLIRVGMTERALRAELIARLYQAGADHLSFDPIVVTGPGAAQPHGEAGDRPISRGDFLTMDFGVVHRGYCSDTTRTVAVGTATDEMRRVYDVVLRAQRRGIETARAGVAGRTIDAAARDLIAEEGYGAYFGHGFGHCLGIEIHEPGGASPSEESPLPAGTVLSAEPGIYLPGRFGVRIEDVIALTETGARNLTALPKDLLVVG